MTKTFPDHEIWLITGSQDLYGTETLAAVATHSKEIASSLDRDESFPLKLVFKPVLTSAEAIRSLCIEANSSEACVGLITWMHTFSPAKMWINGLKILHKPFLHLHTQFNRDIPWSSINMDFMNLNQSAHGGREFGFIATRMGLKRKVVVGDWRSEIVRKEISIWSRVAVAWQDMQSLKLARFGDNMREVAVTEGNKVSAQILFGFSVDGFGLGDLNAVVNDATDSEIDTLCEEYEDLYHLAEALGKKGEQHKALREAARIEFGLRTFLKDGNFKAFTTTFENLHGLGQLPGLAVQRLMEDGYGFGAEGDWKTAALLRCMKVMGKGLAGGTSFMEDYTYHFERGRESVLGAHMLEICPSIAAAKPSCEIHPLGIGGKSDPVRLVFGSAPGPAINASLIDLGDHFKLLVNPVNVIEPMEDLPKLPVARVLWKPEPDLYSAAREWILAGGGHHTAFSQSLSSEYIENLAEMAGIEHQIIC